MACKAFVYALPLIQLKKMAPSSDDALKTMQFISANKFFLQILLQKVFR